MGQDPRSTLDAKRYGCAIGRIRFKRHRPRETRKDAMAIARKLIETTEKLKAELAAARFRVREPVMFRGMGRGG